MDPFARDLLDRGRGAHDPSTGDRDRVRRKVVARIGAGVILASGSAKATGAAVWWGVAKVAVPLVVAAAIGGAVWHERARPVAPVVAVAPPTVSAPALVADAPPPVVASAADPTEVPSPPPVAAPRLATGKAKVASADSLEAETLLLADAQSAIARGDFNGALAKLDEHERTFPNGALNEERMAARVVALCGAGRSDEAKALGKTFLRRYPKSPLVPRVKTSCATP